MYRIDIIKNNDKAILMKLYDENSQEIDLGTFSFINIFLKGKKEDETNEEETPINLSGSVFTDENSEKWISFSLDSLFFSELDIDNYICEIIIEKEVGRFYNAFINGLKDHRFVLKIKDSYI